MLEKLLDVKKLREQRHRRKIVRIEKQLAQIEIQKQKLYQQRLQIESQWKQLQTSSGLMDRREFTKLRSQLNTCFARLCDIAEKKSNLDAEKADLKEALTQKRLDLKKNQISQEKISIGMPPDDHESE